MPQTQKMSVLDEVENYIETVLVEEGYETTDAETATVTVATTDPTTVTFKDFNLPEKLMQALNRMNFNTPTPIQAQAIPLAMTGKDILGSAQTGTGKTGAFGIPLVAKLMENPNMTGLVMTPTRELATQVMAMLEQLVPMGVKTALLIGGEPMPKQFAQLRNVPRLVVGTPGRINDHLVRGTLKLHRTGFLVLDETDRMLDMGFSIQIDEIAKHLPKERQTLLFSATMPSNIVKLSAKYMHNPQRISVGSTTTPMKNIKQELILVNESDKYPALIDQLEKREGSVIIFVKTKHGTERLADKLNKMDFRADAINGDLQQRKRDRVIQSFRDKKFTILVATDVAARGLDIPHIETVINYDLPQVPEDYIHRIGRTGRNGATGEAVNLLTPADKIKWRAIQRLIDPNAAQDKDEPRQQQKRSGGGNAFGARKPFGAKPSFGGQRRDDAPRSYDRAPRREDDRAPQRRDDAPRSYDRAPRREDDRAPQRRDDAPRSFDRAPRRDDAPRSFDRAPRRDDAPRSYDRAPQRREDDRAPQRRDDRPTERRESADRPFGGFGAPKRASTFGDRPQRSERPAFGDAPRGNGGNKPFGRKPAPGGKPFGAKKPFSKPFGRRNDA